MHAGHAAYLAAQANEMVERVNGIGAHAITLWSRVLPHSLNGNKIGRDGMRTLAAALRHCTQLQRLGYVRPARLTSPVTLPVSWLLSVRFWSSRPTIDRSCTPIVSRAALSGALSHTDRAIYGWPHPSNPNGGFDPHRVGWNNIGDDGMCALAASLECLTKLTTL